MLARLIVTLALLGLAAPVAAQPWRYVDKRGRVHYTNDPNKLPRNKRKRAQEAIERKRKQREEAAAAAAAAAANAPASVTSIAIPSAAPESKPKEPSAHDIWQDKMKAADKQVADLDTNLKTARDDATKARNKAIITPSGYNSDAHAKAIKRVADLEKQLSNARDAQTRTRKAEPRKARTP